MGNSTTEPTKTETNAQVFAALLAARASKETIRAQAGKTSIDLLAMPGSIARATTEVVGTVEDSVSMLRNFVALELTKQKLRHKHEIANMTKAISREYGEAKLEEYIQDEALKAASPELHLQLTKFIEEGENLLK